MTNPNGIRRAPAVLVAAATVIVAIAVPYGTAQESRPLPTRSIFFPDDPDRIPLPSTTPRASRFFAVLDIAARRDPARDDDPIEKLAVAAEARISEFARGEYAGLADGAVATRLLLNDAPIVFDDRNFLVRRETSTRDDETAAAREMLDAFFAPIRAAGSTIAEGSVVAVDDVDETAFATQASLTLGFVRDGRTRQINTQWRIVWNKDAPLRAREFRRIAFEEVSANAPIFRDRSRTVLAAVPKLVETGAIGGEAAYESTDRLFGTDLLAHAGLAISDVDGDGRDDLYLCRSGGLPNALLLHRKDGSVEDIAAANGVDFLDLTRAALFFDVDGDSDRDLLLSIRNATIAFENDGKGGFGKAPRFASRSPQASDFYSMAAADYDRDGLIDLYAVRYVQGSYGLTVPLPYFDARNGPPNRMLRNLGDWRFDDVTDAIGLNDGNDRFSLAAAFEDIDDDGDLDLFVANDFGRSNLYVQTNGRFKDEAETRGALNIAAGMGVSFADYDLDGFVDLYVSNMYSASGKRQLSRKEYRAADGAASKSLMMGHVTGNALFRGKGSGAFENASSAARPEAGGWSWGALFVDFNGDGFEDILVPNGNLTGSRTEDVDSLFWRKTAAKSPWTATPTDDYANGWAAQSILMQAHYSWAGRQRNATYLNLGDGTFADISTLSGFGSLDDGRAIAVTDWDKDGDLDLWVKNRTAPELRFLENRSEVVRPNAPPLRFVAFDLRGKGKNVDAVGAVVEVVANGKKHRRSLRAGDGYLSQSSKEIVLPLGPIEKIDDVRVRWPSGGVEAFGAVECDRRYRLVEGSARAEPLDLRPERLVDRDDEPLPGRAKNAMDDRSGYLVELFDRPPLPTMKVALPGGGVLSTDKMLGRPYALLFWSAKSPRSVAALAKIVATKDALKAAGTEILPLSVDTDADQSFAKEIAAGIDPSMPILRADATMLDFVDVLQQDVSARTDDLLLPTAIVVDRLGLIAALHRGRGDASEIMRSAKRARGEFAPYEGRIAFGGNRNYAFFASEFRSRKRTDFADFFQALDRKMREKGAAPR